ncbi:hypothetical protein CAP48_15825 [Advenella sp. S44]|nr:hypothetical protein CAP48_15825 [Advenella sp. S44]
MVDIDRVVKARGKTATNRHSRFGLLPVIALGSKLRIIFVAACAFKSLAAGQTRPLVNDD